MNTRSLKSLLPFVSITRKRILQALGRGTKRYQFAVGAQGATQIPRALVRGVFIFLMVMPTLLPLFRSGFFTMHDDQQVIRLIELDQALSSGQFPVRWVPNLGFGYGYPLFIFYPPAIYYLGEIYHLLFNLSFIASIKLVFLSALVLSAYSMFTWAKNHLNPSAAILSSLFYSYVPYKAVDAYVRGALAELFAFIWLPLIMHSIDQIALQSKLQKKWLLWLSITYALLMLSHNLIALPFSIIIGIYSLFKLISNPHKLITLKTIFLGILLGLTLSTFFWAPALMEKQYTLVDSILLTEKYTYSQHFVEPAQLWNSLWGYGGSTTGTLDGFTLKIGKLHIILSLLTMIITSFLLLSKRLTKSMPLHLQSSQIFLLFIFSAFMTTQYSAPIWQWLHPLQYLQFPWRFLTFTALFSSFLAGVCYHLTQQYLRHPMQRFLLMGILIILLLLPNLKLFKPQQYLTVEDAHYASEEFTKWTISKTSFEFVPIGVQTRINPQTKVTELAINRESVAVTPLEIIEGSPQINLNTNLPHLKSIDISSPEPSILRFNTFNFPGWQATIDGQKIDINDNNSLKLITFTIPPGDHHLLIRFNNTPIRTLANFISLFGIIICLGIVFNKPIIKLGVTHASSNH